MTFLNYKQPDNRLVFGVNIIIKDCFDKELYVLQIFDKF